MTLPIGPNDARARADYAIELGRRRQGVASGLVGDAGQVAAKPHFYADARGIIDGARQEYANFGDTYPPYGLVERGGAVLGRFFSRESDRRDPWTRLELAMSATVQMAFEAVTPPSTGCPYAASLGNLGARTLRPHNPMTPETQRLFEVVAPGGMLAPTLIVNLLRRMPAIARYHGAPVDTVSLADNSPRSLLREPLSHPQQHARAFMFTLAPGVLGSDFMIDRRGFMTEQIIADYTKLGGHRGRPAVTWSRPTSEFTLQTDVGVADRTRGSEAVADGEHIIRYPKGTPLGAIEATEPTIGCPGSTMAYELWHQALGVIHREEMWQLNP